MLKLKKSKSSVSDLQAFMQRLRDVTDGCPWSREQTLTSLISHTLEEVYEVVDAIEQHDIAALQQELADLLLQIGFYSQIAAEQGWFNLSDVEQTCIAKQLQRKPHLRKKSDINSQQAVEQWETIKSEQRQQQDHCFSDIAKALPALTRANKIQQRAARLGFDWPDATPVYDKCIEELDEVKQAVTSGDQQHIQEEIGRPTVRLCEPCTKTRCRSRICLDQSRSKIYASLPQSPTIS